MRSFRHDNDVPFYAYHLETMSPFMLITRPPHDKQTMSPFMLITSGNNVPFYAYQNLILRFSGGGGRDDDDSGRKGG